MMIKDTVRPYNYFQITELHQYVNFFSHYNKMNIEKDFNLKSTICIEIDLVFSDLYKPIFKHKLHTHWKITKFIERHIRTSS